MKYKGKVVNNNNVEYVVIPRGEEKIVFVAKPVLTLQPFNEMYPEPQPPILQYTDKPAMPDYNDPDYKKQLQDYFVARMHWVYLTSLKDSPDIEWETVDMLKPHTYENWAKELADAQFLPAEINKIQQAIQLVNGLDERQLDKAREDFLASLQAQDA